MIQKQTKQKESYLSSVFKNQSLTSKVTTLQILAILLFSIFALSLTSLSISKYQEEQLQNMADDYLNTAQQILKLPVWKLDAVAVQNICTAFVKNEHIAFFKLIAINGDILCEYSTGVPDFNIERRIVLQYEENLIGEIQISLSTDSNIDAIDNLFFYALFLITSIALSLIIVNRIILKKQIDLPLSFIMERIENVRSGEYKHHKVHLGKEFDAILHKFSDMSAAVLSRENKLQEEIEFRTAAEKVKKTLLQEIHHRVKNNLTVVSSLLKLQANSMDDERLKEALNESQNRIYAMSAVHETLHGSENLSKIDLKNYLSKVTTSIFQAYSTDHQKAKLNCKIEAAPISINQAYPLGLVINELLSNSMKYAFPDDRTGEISVSFQKHDKELEFIIKDDGIGISDGFDWKNSKSLGLKLVRTLVENQLDGSIDMESKNGTKFTIKFNIET